MAGGFDGWAVVEMMGHVRMAGRVTEEERFGNSIGRCDVPKAPDTACLACRGTGTVASSVVGEGEPEHRCRLCGGFTTVYFTGASIYRLTPCTEEAARAVARRCQPEPVHEWEIPSRKALLGPDDFDEEEGQ